MENSTLMTETIHLKLPAIAENTLPVRLLVAGLANLHQFNSEEIEDMKLAVSEACAFTHEGSHWLDLAVHVDSDKLAIDIQSEAVLQKPMIAHDDAALSGIGFELMKKLVDSMEYKSEGKSTFIRLTKYSKKNTKAKTA